MYPQQPYPPQGFAPQAPQFPPAYPAGYPQQQYAAPAAPAPAMPTGPAPAANTLFGGGNSFKFDQPGHEVTLDITGVDVRPQTEKNTSRIKTWQDGSTMYMVICTGTVVSSNHPMFPAGSVSSVTLSGGRFSAAKIAFAAVKVQGPAVGGRLRMKFTQLSDRPPSRPGDSPAKRYEAQYWPPAAPEMPIMPSDAQPAGAGAPTTPVPQVQPAAPVAPPVQTAAAAYIGSPDPAAQYPQQPVSAPVAPAPVAPVMSAPPAPVAPQTPVQPAAPTQAPAIDPGLWAMLTPDQRAQYLAQQPTPF